MQQLCTLLGRERGQKVAALLAFLHLGKRIGGKFGRQRRKQLDLLSLVQRLDQIRQVGRMKLGRVLAHACKVATGREGLQAFLALLDVVLRRAH